MVTDKKLYTLSELWEMAGKKPFDTISDRSGSIHLEGRSPSNRFYGWTIEDGAVVSYFGYLREWKKHPTRIVFECEWILYSEGILAPNSFDVRLYNFKGKRTRVTVEEIVE